MNTEFKAVQFPMRKITRLAGVLIASICLVAHPAWAAGAFQRSLALQGVRFNVTATGAGSQQQLTITSTAGKRVLKPIHRTVDGQVVEAEVADLNGNGQPELYVYVQSAGSGSYGELVAYSVINGDQLSPIYLQELSAAPAHGYRGHDEFRIVEGCLVRRFPIYKASDSNAKASGGLRQICYKLRNGETSWILRPTSVLQF